MTMIINPITSTKSKWTPSFTGIFLFLISEFVLFGALFFVYYFLRVMTAVWPPDGVEFGLARPLANTVILLASSVTIYMAVRSIRRGDSQKASLFTGITVALGLMFLGITVWEWLQESFRPWSSAYGSIFYTLTGFHALHVLGGVLLLSSLLNRMRKGRYGAQKCQAVEIGSYYWHYVDFIWILVFTSLFIIR